jgi:NADPH2:quinone reductase
MKAVQVTRFGGPEVLGYVDLPDPSPGEGQVLVRAEGIGVNFADLKAREGGHISAAPPPFIPGLEAAGTVLAVGGGVRRMAPGDRVVAFPAGAYAERVVASEALTYLLPAGVPFDAAAAFLLVFNTAYHALKTQGRLAAGESVMVHAAGGGVGTAAVQLAKLWGARVFACAGSDEKLARVKALGADETINYITQDVAEEIKRRTGGRGVDLVLDSVGGEIFDKSLQSLGLMGRLVIFGNSSGRPRAVDETALQGMSKTVAGLSVGGIRARRPDFLRPGCEELLRLLAEGRIRPVIGRTLPLREAAEAHRFLASRASYGKILLTP